MLSRETLYMSLAIGLTVMGSIGNALGYVIQKKGHLMHVDKNEVREIRDEEPQSILTNKTWVAGFVICLAGSILTAVAFKFGAQSVLAPLSALVLVCNAIFATKFLGEPFTQKHFYGIVLVIIGSVLAVMFGPKSNTTPATLLYIEHCWRNTIFLAYFSALTVSICILYALIKVYEDKNSESMHNDHKIVIGAKFMMVAYIILAAYFGSVNVLFMKSLMMIIGSFEIAYLDYYLFYVTCGGIILVNILLEFFRQKAIKFFDASYVVPIFQVLLILGAALMGAVFFGEFKHLSQMQLLLFMMAIFITVLGVAVLAFELGEMYKKMIRMLDKQMNRFSFSALSVTSSKENQEIKQLTIRSKRRQSFEKRPQRRRRLPLAAFPAFPGASSAIMFASNQNQGRQGTPHPGEPRLSMEDLELHDSEDSPYTRMRSHSLQFPDTTQLSQLGSQEDDCRSGGDSVTSVQVSATPIHEEDEDLDDEEEDMMDTDRLLSSAFAVKMKIDVTPKAL